jgi:hypothetical protein
MYDIWRQPFPLQIAVIRLVAAALRR